MSKVIYNATLEYSPNKLEFWMYDKDETPINFDPGLKFTIGRIDDDSVKYEVMGTTLANKAVFDINPTKSLLAREGDDLFSYDEPVYEHYFSVKSYDNVYIVGKLNMVQA